MTEPGDSTATEPEDVGTLEGTVDSIVYRSEDTGYTVCRIRMPGKRDLHTLVGSCGAIWAGENVRADGKWTRHPQHGFQFQADSIVCIVPTSARGIERYLASGMIRGIGKVMANRLVAKFGPDSLRIIDTESKRLEEVEGIGPVRRKMIKESWDEHKAVRDIMIFLRTHGIGAAQATRIYRQYGDQSIAMISNNPYRLVREIWGIGFKTADSVAMSLGVPRHSPLRARAGVLHVLQTLTDEGHCFATEEELAEQAVTLLEIPEPIITEAIAYQLQEGQLIRDVESIYLAHLYEAEVSAADHVARLFCTKAPFRPIDVERAVPWAEQQMGLEFAPEQSNAIRMALSEKVSIMTGGPGVGKTTIIKALVDVFKARRLSVLLAAPTGRAAKRMEEATQNDARTIHRLLRFQPRTGEFEHNEDNPLEGDVFILDEVSMVDIQLMATFLQAVPDKACLVLVGDVDQLPSVGPGNVLRDLIESDVIPCTRLDHVFRQRTGGWIVHNAHRINRGEWFEIPPHDEDFSDFHFFETKEPDKVIERVKQLVTKRIPEHFGFQPMRDIQVLTPMRRNQLGADNLNAVLQAAMNPSGTFVSRFGRRYRDGDRVMQIRNNYDKDVFNGDIGRITKVDTTEQVIVVEFDGRAVSYDFADLDELLHAYAGTIHKSQGSEYPVVVILLATQHYRLLQRNLLYTAITRGRRLVCIVGSSKAVWIAIRNNEIRFRRTALERRVRGHEALVQKPSRDSSR